MKKVLGVRCGHDGYAYCVLEGTRTNPKVVYISDKFIPAPKKTKPQGLLWFFEEFEKFTQRYSPNFCTINLSGKRRNYWKAGDFGRMETEAILRLVYAKHNRKKILEKTNKQLEPIKPSFQKYLMPKLKTSDTKVLEAARIAYYGLKNDKR